MYRKRNCINEKILLTALNARYSHSNLALRYLRETVSDLPIEVVVMEFSINQESDAIMDMIEEVSPDILGFSVYIWNNAMTAELLQRLKDKNIPVLLGGPEVSYNQDKWFDAFSNVKWIICGPGEGAFKKLASSDFSSPGGLLRRKIFTSTKSPSHTKRKIWKTCSTVMSTTSRAAAAPSGAAIASHRGGTRDCSFAISIKSMRNSPSLSATTPVR